MTLLLQLAVLWSLASVVVAVGCSLLFRGAAAGDRRAARVAAAPEGDAHPAT